MPSFAVALVLLLWAPGALAWDPFWSEDPAVERGNERFLAQAPRDAIDSYRSAPMSQRPEVQYDIGLAALALAQSVTLATPPAAPAPPAAAPLDIAQGGPGTGAVTPGQPGTPEGATAAPAPATPTDDLSLCLAGTRPACLRLAAASFARATGSRDNPGLRANAFHSLGNVYLLQADDVKPPDPPAIPDLADKECKDVQAALQALQQVIDSFADAAAPLDKAVDQFRSALVERPGDQDSSWNLSLSVRRRRELDDRKETLLAQKAALEALAAEKCKDQNQDQQQNQDQNQDQDQDQNQDQNQDQQEQQDRQQQDQQDQQQQQSEEERQRQEEQRRQQQQQQNGEQQDIQQQLQNLRDQEELFQQMRQREESQQDQQQPFLVPRQDRQAPERDW
ncbi:MAG: hypothetical protein HY905_10055 [Deltaproteobacteria bacterium]|nr:hypothetical protein [Deltaproteobacteria bacterium]